MAGDGQLVLSDRHRGDPRLQGKNIIEFVSEMDQRPALAEFAATLPAERVAVLRERGQARDLEATVAELLAELRESAPLA